MGRAAARPRSSCNWSRESTGQTTPWCGRRLLVCSIRERVLDLLGARVAVPGAVPAGGSVSKLMYSDHARLTAEAATNLLGADGGAANHEAAAPWLERLLFAPGLRIGGGTDEIQRNTIGEQGLGLPREPRPPTSDTGAGLRTIEARGIARRSPP